MLVNELPAYLLNMPVAELVSYVFLLGTLLVVVPALLVIGHYRRRIDPARDAFVEALRKLINDSRNSSLLPKIVERICTQHKPGALRDFELLFDVIEPVFALLIDEEVFQNDFPHDLVREWGKMVTSVRDARDVIGDSPE